MNRNAAASPGPLGRLSALTGLPPTAIRLALLAVLLVPSGCIATLYFAGRSTDDFRANYVAEQEAPSDRRSLEVDGVVVEAFAGNDGRVCIRFDPDFGGDFSCYSDRRLENGPVSIDVVDEPHSLRLALDRLLIDEGLRRELGVSAREWWASHHQPAMMAESTR